MVVPLSGSCLPNSAASSLFFTLVHSCSLSFTHLHSFVNIYIQNLWSGLLQRLVSLVLGVWQRFLPATTSSTSSSASATTTITLSTTTLTTTPTVARLPLSQITARTTGAQLRDVTLLARSTACPWPSSSRRPLQSIRSPEPGPQKATGPSVRRSAARVASSDLPPSPISWTDRATNRQEESDRQAGSQAVRESDRQTNTEAERHTDMHRAYRVKSPGNPPNTLS